MLSRRCLRAWCTSLIISPMVRTSDRARPCGLAANDAYPRARRPGNPARLTVSRLCGASPENALLILTPPSASRPRPLLNRRSISAASRGRLVTIRRPASFSYQRKAGTYRDAPCRMPAWLVGVVDGIPVCHSMNRCEPERTHRLRVGRFPAVTAHRSSGADSPSIWMMTTPGPSNGGLSSLPYRATWRMTSPMKVSSLPASASQPTIAAITAVVQATPTAAPKPRKLTSGSICSAT